MIFQLPHIVGKVYANNTIKRELIDAQLNSTYAKFLTLVFANYTGKYIGVLN